MIVEHAGWDLPDEFLRRWWWYGAISPARLRGMRWLPGALRLCVRARAPIGGGGIPPTERLPLDVYIDPAWRSVGESLERSPAVARVTPPFIDREVYVLAILGALSTLHTAEGLDYLVRSWADLRLHLARVQDEGLIDAIIPPAGGYNPRP